ncbi:MAG: hypothetical protein RSA18_04200 [Bacilli bacterium]
MIRKNGFKIMKFAAIPMFACLLLASCGGESISTPPVVDKFDVSFLEGETLLKKVQVEKNKTVERPVDLEKKSGYTFVDWFATPSKNHVYNFATKITEAKKIYAGFSKYQNDERDWYVVGSGQGELLSTSNWGKVTGPEFLMTKENVEGKNIFKMTLDLYEGDEFQFGGLERIHKRGFGYLKEPVKDSITYFGGNGGGYGEVASKGQNIQVKKSGNYTFTLASYPADFTYNTSDPSYTEAKKEVYNMGVYDNIVWTRNGDAAKLPDSVINWYIKGQNITNWKEFHTPYTRFAKIGKTYNLKVYLKSTDQVMFNSFSTDLATGVESTSQIGYVNGGSGTRSTEFDKLFTTAGNFAPKADGTYNITINTAEVTPVITATFAKETPELFTQDFYVNGTFVDPAYGAVTNTSILPQYKLKKDGDKSIYKIEGITVKAGDQLIVQSMKAGATVGKDNWGTAFGYPFAAPNAIIEKVDDKNSNIKIVTAGTYEVTFDAYTRIVKVGIKGNDIYLKGSFDACGTGTNWAHGFAAALKFAPVAKVSGMYMLGIDIANSKGGDFAFGLEIYDIGVTTGGGSFAGNAQLGTLGISAQCKQATGNAKFPGAGKYRITYDNTNNVIDVYTSNPYAA